MRNVLSTVTSTPGSLAAHTPPTTALGCSSRAHLAAPTMPRPLASQRLGGALLGALLGSVAGQTAADDKQALLDAKAAATAAANAAINSDANAPRCHSMHGGTGPCPLETWEAGAQLSLRWAARSVRFARARAEADTS